MESAHKSGGGSGSAPGKSPAAGTMKMRFFFSLCRPPVPGCDVTCDGAVVSRAGAGAGGEGVLCHACGYQYPNGHPSAKQRRAHRKHCGKPASAAAAAEGSGEHEASELLLGTVGSVPPWWCTGLVCRRVAVYVQAGLLS